MANINVDINRRIDELGLNANSYKLNKSTPPHEIIDWAAGNPDVKPTDAELLAGQESLAEIERKTAELKAIDDAEAAAVAAGYEYTHDGKTLVFELSAEYAASINVLEKTSSSTNPNTDLEVSGINKITGWPDIFSFTPQELKEFTEAYERYGALKKRDLNRARKAAGDS